MLKSSSLSGSPSRSSNSPSAEVNLRAGSSWYLRGGKLGGSDPTGETSPRISLDLLGVNILSNMNTPL